MQRWIPPGSPQLPLFILCLIFDQTKPLFQKWLMYGIGTVFSLAMLSFISTIVLNVTARAAALWGSNLINNMLGTNSEGLSTQALEQGGIGLLMTMLIISVPPMAGNFFSAPPLGSISGYSIFSRAGQPGANGQPGMGGYGYEGYGPSQIPTQSQAGNQTGFNLPGSASSSGVRLTNSGYTSVGDFTKQGGGLANPPAGG